MASATKTATKSKARSKANGSAKSAAASKPAAKTAAPRPFAVKSFARTILYVRDWAPSVRFYTDVLGLSFAYPAEDGWAEFTTGATALCLHGGRAPDAKTEAVCSVGFGVDDFDAAVAALRGKGVRVGDPTSPCAGLRIAHFADPSGNDLYVEGK